MIELNNKQYEIPATVGELPARRGLAIITALGKITKEEISMDEFNFIYVSNVLGIPQSEIEAMCFSDFLKVLGEINKSFSVTTINNTPIDATAQPE